jgi:hypothetical protein
MCKTGWLLVAWLSAVFAAPAFAWGPEGHQAVGAIADTLLEGHAAQARVRAILGNIPLEQAAVWADCAKGVTSPDGVTFTYRADDRRFPECAPFAGDGAAFERYVSRNWKQCGGAKGREMCHHHYHYADISTRRDRYDAAAVGAREYDVVHAIGAAVAVLQGQPGPPPFALDEREALLLLAHLVGDVHQPLHVEAIYLDARGHGVDPDASGYRAANDTIGGNAIFDGTVRFHHEWDAIPTRLGVKGPGFDNLVAHARTIAASTGEASAWPAAWASDTIHAGHAAFTGLHFTGHPVPSGTPPEWMVSGTRAFGYPSRAEDLKAAQLAKAGARLAQLLQALWPDAGSPP